MNALIALAGDSHATIDLDTLKEEQLADFGAVEMREKGMIGAAMGTTALSASGRWWAVPVKYGTGQGNIARLHVIDMSTGAVSVACELEHLSRGCESVLRFVTLRCLFVLFKRAIEIARFHMIARFCKQHRRPRAIPRVSQVLTQKS